jgi:hypothetical protein
MERQKKKGKIIEALKYENIFEAEKKYRKTDYMIISMKCILFFFMKSN